MSHITYLAMPQSGLAHLERISTLLKHLFTLLFIIGAYIALYGWHFSSPAALNAGMTFMTWIFFASLGTAILVTMIGLFMLVMRRAKGPA